MFSCVKRRASVAQATGSFPGMGMVRKFIVSVVMIGCVIVAPMWLDVVSPGVKKPGGLNPGAPMPPCCCGVMKGAIGVEVMMTYGLEARRCGASPAAGG